MEILSGDGGNITVSSGTRSGWRVYFRLIKYAGSYKSRLITAVLLSLVIAFSFGTMIVTLGTAIKITLYQPHSGLINQYDKNDPALKYAKDIEEWDVRFHGWLNRGPGGWKDRFLNLVATMRQRKLVALSLAVGIVIILTFISGCARFLQEYFAGSVGAFISIDLSRQMYENILNQSLGFYEAHTSGDIVARFSNDIFMVNRGLSNAFIKALREPFKAITFLGVALMVDPLLTLVGVCILPPLGYALIQLGLYVRKSVRRSLMKVADLASLINETTRGIIVVKGFQIEDFLKNKFHIESQRLRRFLSKMVKADSATEPISEFILVVGFSAFVLFSGYRVIAHNLDIGDLFQVYLALAMTLDPVRKLSTVNNLIQTSVASAERIFEFLDIKPDIVDVPNAVEIPPLTRELRFENVSFSYDGEKQVLKNISFSVKKGEKVALVGPSGAGKTTIVKLIPRFYDVLEGTIFIDDIDIRKVSIESLRKQIAIVTQETVLFSGSVRENLIGGRKDISDEEVYNALKMAHAYEFVVQLPQGLDSNLGEFGQLLSGGQRQRLALARAILKNPAILLLDEATSNLDSESEKYIQDALTEFLRGRTSIIIAHRLSTITSADRIVVLDKGEIVEMGTHEELIMKRGTYYQLYKHQFAVRDEN
ncbi:MAG: ABC transporter ATP-binding protein/permease [Candidatus Hydrogenedentes bacterium]|nr:ABC transporter ATP-binding protein/permease [Candidatus Hydrogenedentota bacterium]